MIVHPLTNVAIRKGMHEMKTSKFFLFVVVVVFLRGSQGYLTDCLIKRWLSRGHKEHNQRFFYVFSLIFRGFIQIVRGDYC